MNGFGAKFAVASLCLLLSSGIAAAQQVTLKLAYFSSDRTTNYLAAIEPFVHLPDGPACAARAIGYLRGLAARAA